MDQLILVLELILIKLCHIDLGIEDNSQAIVIKNKDLAGLRQEQRAHDKALKSARADRANAHCVAEGEEYKEAEKILDSKVLLFY